MFHPWLHLTHFFGDPYPTILDNEIINEGEPKHDGDLRKKDDTKNQGGPKNFLFYGIFCFLTSE